MKRRPGTNRAAIDATTSIAQPADVAARNARRRWRRVAVDRDRYSRWALYRWVRADPDESPSDGVPDG